MLRATMSNLVQERHEELTELGSHLSQLVIEKNMVVRNKKANEAEKKRVVAEIQKLRTKVANINSQISQVGLKHYQQQRMRTLTSKMIDHR